MRKAIDRTIDGARIASGEIYDIANTNYSNLGVVSDADCE